MIFSSITFIYYFLPILLIIYYLIKNKFKNTVLLIFSILFYFLGEPKFLWVLILSCIVNYICGNLIYKSKHKKSFLVVSIIFNILMLFVFKYLDFFISIFNDILNTNFNYLNIIMPIGISFFTFQALGYVIDIYRKKHEPADNLFDFITYISLFPQLIAGPIVRYVDIKDDLKVKKISLDNFSLGIRRFIIGLSKKVLLANVLGEAAKNLVEIDLVSSWLKPIFYTLQIYFDFSGMAIGMGLMLGFRFLENFNYPLISSSITEFWRRWHISLSSWFRDYVYIPLGGNRATKIRNYINIFIVWLLTGFWHGASWNFIIWGLYFFVFLVIEKMFLKKVLDKTKIIKYIYTFIIIIISFLIFNVESVDEIFSGIKNMFYLNGGVFCLNSTRVVFKNYLVLLIISFIGATPLMKYVSAKLLNCFKNLHGIIEIICLLFLLVLSTAFLIDDAFNPFLYFRF